MRWVKAADALDADDAEAEFGNFVQEAWREPPAEAEYRQVSGFKTVLME